MHRSRAYLDPGLMLTTLLGPFRVAHDTPNLESGIALTVLDEGQLLLDVRVFVADGEDFDGGAQLEFGLGNNADPTWYYTLGSTITLGSATEGMLAGSTSVDMEDEGIRWGFARGDFRTLSAFLTTSASTGEADIYALIAESV